MPSIFLNSFPLGSAAPEYLSAITQVASWPLLVLLSSVCSQAGCTPTSRSPCVMPVSRCLSFFSSAWLLSLSPPRPRASHSPNSHRQIPAGRERDCAIRPRVLSSKEIDELSNNCCLSAAVPRLALDQYRMRSQKIDRYSSP